MSKRNYTLLFLLTFISSVNIYAQSPKKWTLKECVAYALENNISIQQSYLDLKDSDISQKEALGNFLPNVNANANQSWNRGLTINPITGANSEQTSSNTSVGANVSVDLFKGLRNHKLMQRAKLARIASQYQLENIKDNISLNVANAFLQILFNIENLRVLESQKMVTEQEIARTKELISSGILPQGDIYEIEASLASQEQQIVDAQNNIRLTKINLAQLLLIDDYESFDISQEEIEMVESSEAFNSSPKEIANIALESQYNIKTSKANIELAEKDFQISKSGYLPSLSAFYSFDTRASNQDRIRPEVIEGPIPDIPIGTVVTTGDQVVAPGPSTRAVAVSADPILDQFNQFKGHRFGFNLSIPIFNRFANQVNTQRTRLNIERAKLNLEQTKIDVQSTVNQAYNDAKGSLKAFHAAEKTALARKQAFDYAEQRHEVGVINSFEYQRTKQQLESAESDVIRAKYDYIFKLKILEFYFGIPIEESL